MKRIVLVFALFLGLMASVTPVGAVDIYRSIYADNTSPQQNTNVTVWVHVCYDYECTQPYVGLPIHTVWHYKTTDATLDWQTGNDGKAAMIRNISDATVGYTVYVDVYFKNYSGEWQKFTQNASFTPVVTNAAAYGQSASTTTYVGASDTTSSYTSSAYVAPSYTAPSYTASSYTAPSYTAPSYTTPSYTAPAYTAPSSASMVSNGPVSGSGGVCPDGYPVKANANSGIYHMPGQQYYSVTNANNCYASADAAAAAGYRASKV